MRDSVTYLTEGPQPAKSPVYYMDYVDGKGIKRFKVIKFRCNGVRGQFITTDAEYQDYLDNHVHLLKEGKLSRHMTATITHKSEEPGDETPRQTVGPAMATPVPETRRRPGRPSKVAAD